MVTWAVPPVALPPKFMLALLMSVAFPAVAVSPKDALPELTRWACPAEALFKKRANPPLLTDELPALALVSNSNTAWLVILADPALEEPVKVAEPVPVTAKSPAEEEFWKTKFPSLTRDWVVPEESTTPKPWNTNNPELFVRV